MFKHKNSRLGGVYIQFVEQKRPKTVSQKTTENVVVEDSDFIYLVDEKYFYLTDEFGNKLCFRKSEV